MGDFKQAFYENISNFNKTLKILKYLLIFIISLGFLLKKIRNLRFFIK